MPQKKQKIVLSGQVRLPEQLDREIDVECARLGIYKYELIARMWATYEAAIGHAGNPSSQHPRTQIGASLQDSSVTLNESAIQSANSTSRSSHPSEKQDVGKITPQERPWVIRLLNLLRSGTVAARAIQWNLLSFQAVLGEQIDASVDPVPRPIPKASTLEEAEQTVRDLEEALNSQGASRSKDRPA